MLYWPTEKGSPCVVEDMTPHPTEHSVRDDPDAWLGRALMDAEQCYMDNLARMRMRYLQQIEDLYNTHQLRMEAMWRANQEAQSEQAPIQ